MRTRQTVPCHNFKKCGNTVTRDSALVKRKVNFICEPCRTERNKKYARLQREALKAMQARLVPADELAKFVKRKEWRYAGILRHLKKK